MSITSKQYMNHMPEDGSKQNSLFDTMTTFKLNSSYQDCDFYDEDDFIGGEDDDAVMKTPPFWFGEESNGMFSILLFDIRLNTLFRTCRIDYSELFKVPQSR